MKNVMFTLFTCVSMFTQAQVGKYNAAIKTAAEKLNAQVIAWRQDIHLHPELGNRETRTSALIAAHLRKSRGEFR